MSDRVLRLPLFSEMNHSDLDCVVEETFKLYIQN